MIETSDGRSPQEQASISQPVDFLRELKEPEKRTPMYGIGVISEGTKKYHNVFFLEPYEEGYQVHISVVDSFVPRDRKYFGTSEGPVPSITVTTNLDRELETTGFSVGFTNCTSLGRFTEVQIGNAVLDSTHELHDFFSDFHKVAKNLQEERIANGALDPFLALSRDMLSKRSLLERKQFAIGRTIRDEFLHLGKNSIARKFMEDGVSALFENSEKSERAEMNEDVRKSLMQFMENPTFEVAARVRLLLSGIAWSRTETTNTGNYFYGRTAHLKYTQPGTNLPSFVNLAILHALCLGEESPYTTLELEEAAILVNGGNQRMKGVTQTPGSNRFREPKKVVGPSQEIRPRPPSITSKKRNTRKVKEPYDAKRISSLLDEIAKERQRRTRS